MRRFLFNLAALASLGLFTGLAVRGVAACSMRVDVLRVSGDGRVLGWGPWQGAWEWRSARAAAAELLFVPPLTFCHSAAGFHVVEGRLGGAEGDEGGQADYRLVVVPLWFPMVLTAVAPAWWLAARRGPEEVASRAGISCAAPWVVVAVVWTFGAAARDTSHDADGRPRLWYMTADGRLLDGPPALVHGRQ